MSESSHSLDVSQAEQPPQPPPVRRRLDVTRTRGTVVSLRALTMVLALPEVLAGGREFAPQRSDAFELTIDDPSRFRYEQLGHLRVTVRNAADRPLDPLAARPFRPGFLHP